MAVFLRGSAGTFWRKIECVLMAVTILSIAVAVAAKADAAVNGSGANERKRRGADTWIPHTLNNFCPWAECQGWIGCSPGSSCGPAPTDFVEQSRLSNARYGTCYAYSYDWASNDRCNDGPKEDECACITNDRVLQIGYGVEPSHPQTDAHISVLCASRFPGKTFTLSDSPTTREQTTGAPRSTSLGLVTTATGKQLTASTHTAANDVTERGLTTDKAFGSLTDIVTHEPGTTPENKTVNSTAGPILFTIYVLFLVPVSVALTVIVYAVVVAIKHRKRRHYSKAKSQHEGVLNQIRDLYEDVVIGSAVPEVADPSQSPSSTSLRRSNDDRQHGRFDGQGRTILLSDNINIVPDDVKIRFSRLDMGRILGQGAFGRVCQAVLTDTESGSQSVVAVKTIQDTSDAGNTIKFLQEGLMMKDFRHPNVLGLLGLTFDPQGQPLVVLPFMANADLKSYLVEHRQELTENLLTLFASHVALGMEYLSRQNFVHRDLAARNCMVDGDLVVKIADFGLSRDLHESDYYRSGDRQAKMPVKWMAPESLDRKVYNAKTDVWSYGVLLWELFSRGSRPYPNLMNKQVYAYLKQGQRMDPPQSCPPKIYNIMRYCWKASPKMRWSFQRIVDEIDRLMAATDGGASLQGPGSSCHPSGSAGLQGTGSTGYLNTPTARGMAAGIRAVPGRSEGADGRSDYPTPSAMAHGLSPNHPTAVFGEPSEASESCYVVTMETMVSDKSDHSAADSDVRGAAESQHIRHTYADFGAGLGKPSGGKLNDKRDRNAADFDVHEAAVSQQIRHTYAEYGAGFEEPSAGFDGYNTVAMETITRGKKNHKAANAGGEEVPLQQIRHTYADFGGPGKGNIDDPEYITIEA